MANPDIGFTWFNKRNNGSTFERLDKVLGNDQWQRKFPTTIKRTLDFFGLDHKSILCDFSEDVRENEIFK